MLRRPKPPLIGAFACLVGLAATGVLAYLSPIAHDRDSRALQGFVELNRPRLTPFVDDVAHLADPASYVLIGIVLALVALARGRARVAIAIPVILLLSGATTEILKPLLAHPRYSEWLGDGQISAAAWPSGHAAASMALALCLVLAAPPRLRPTAAAVGGAFAVGVSYAIMVLGWHFPSDVIGGFFVATMWTLLAIGVLNVLEQRSPSRVRPEPGVRPVDALGPLAIGLLAAALVTGVALARPRTVADFALEHPTFMAGAIAIAALAVAVAAGLARGMRS